MFDVIDKAAKYWPDLSSDPDFYAAKAFLRDRLAGIRGVETLSAKVGSADITVLDAEADRHKVTISL